MWVTIVTNFCECLFKRTCWYAREVSSFKNFWPFYNCVNRYSIRGRRYFIFIKYWLIVNLKVTRYSSISICFKHRKIRLPHSAYSFVIKILFGTNRSDSASIFDSNAKGAAVSIKHFNIKLSFNFNEILNLLDVPKLLSKTSW